MAVNFNNRLFTGGAVSFNTQPEVNMYAQLMARKRAKEDAIDEYYRRLPSTINEAGMRDTERPIIHDMLNNAKLYFLKNKEAIRNPSIDNGEAQYTIEKMYRDAGEVTDRSKQAGKIDLEIGEARFQGKYPWIFKDRGFMDAQKRHSLPVNDEKFQMMDLGRMVLPPKPFGVKEQGEFFKTATGEFKPKKIYDETQARSDRKSGQIFVLADKIL